MKTWICIGLSACLTAGGLAGCGLFGGQSVDAEKTRMRALATADRAVRGGDADRALELMESYLLEEPADPFANEIAAKALIKLGRFEEAGERLLTARNLYESPQDLARAADLAAFNRGLMAHSEADFTGARSAWSRIRHPMFQRAVRSATSVRSVRKPLPPSVAVAR